MQTASENPQGANPPAASAPRKKSRYDISKHARQGSEIAKLLGNSGNRRMDRDALLKRLDSLVRNKETPIQYIAALSSLYAELNMWKRMPDDAKSLESIDDKLKSWKREDGDAYAGLMNQQSVSEAKHIGASSAGASAVGDGGEPPIGGTAAEALDPLSARHSPEKVTQVADSTGVNANKPADSGGDWVE